MKVSELALLKIMHSRISPNTFSMEYYAKAFQALLVLESASIKDLCRLTKLDSQSIEHLVKNLLKQKIIRKNKEEFAINIEFLRLWEMIKQDLQEDLNENGEQKKIAIQRRTTGIRITPPKNNNRNRQCIAMACNSTIH